MKFRILFCSAAICALALTAARSQTKPIPPIPHLQKQGTATQLIVDGKPFLILGGELHNSSSSNLEYMRPIWPKLAATHLNTVLTPVSWELIEPEEGKFDFTLVDGLIQDAKRHNLRLIFLWFGSWKNGVSTYVPLWVKTNLERFPRAQDQTGKGLEILTTFSDANRDADAQAFAALMRHIREVDGEAHTVVMMQPENEVGVLGDSRDRSAAANEAFAKPVPKELMDYLQKHKDTLIPEFRKVWEATGCKTAGTWEEVFGPGVAADEIFMAWNYARYIGRVVEAGKTAYPLPMFVNAWLAQPNDKLPGDFPSGGPLPHVLDVWRAGGPQIEILSPDIYATNFTEWCAWYHRSGNPLFIPETRGGAQGAANAFYAFGQHDAIGYSPFGIDGFADPEGEIAKSYELLSQVAPLVLEYQGKGAMAGVVLDKDRNTKKLRLGDYTLDIGIARQRSLPSPDYAAAIFIALGPDEYLAAGKGVTVSFLSNMPGPHTVGLATVDEGAFVDGRWIPGRRLNGDEILSGKGLRLPSDRYSIQRVKLYHYR